MFPTSGWLLPGKPGLRAGTHLTPRPKERSWHCPVNRAAARPQQEPQQGKAPLKHPYGEQPARLLPPRAQPGEKRPQRSGRGAQQSARSRGTGAATATAPAPLPRGRPAAGRAKAAAAPTRAGSAAPPASEPGTRKSPRRSALTFGPVYHLLRTPLGHRLHGGLSPPGTAARRALGRGLTPSQAPIPVAPLRARPAPAGPSPRAGSSRSPPRSRPAPTCRLPSAAGRAGCLLPPPAEHRGWRPVSWAGRWRWSGLWKEMASLGQGAE